MLVNRSVVSASNEINDPNNPNWFWQCHKCAFPNRMPMSSRNFRAVIRIEPCNSVLSNCFHTRCNQCYDLSSQLEVIRFCSGAPVDLEKYVEWYASFGGACRVSLPPGDNFNKRTPGLGGGRWRMTVKDGRMVTEMDTDSEGDNSNRACDDSGEGEVVENKSDSRMRDKGNKRDMGILGSGGECMCDMRESWVCFCGEKCQCKDCDEEPDCGCSDYQKILEGEEHEGQEAMEEECNDNDDEGGSDEEPIIEPSEGGGDASYFFLREK